MSPRGSARAPCVLALTTLLVAAACPRPLATSTTGPASALVVPPDAHVELVVPRLARAQGLLSRALAVVDVDGGLFTGVRAALASEIGMDPTRPALLTLAALDPEGTVALALRPRGGAWIALPTVDAARTIEALATALGARPRAIRPGVLVLDDGAGRALALVRPAGAHVVVVLEPDDALAEAALLLDDTARRPLVVDAGDAALSFAVAPAALAPLVDVAAGGAPLVGEVDLEADGALTVALAVAAPPARDDEAWALPCDVLDEAVAVARVEAPLLTAVLGEAPRAIGEVELALLPSSTAADAGDLLSALHLVVAGRPRDAAAAASLRASFGGEAVSSSSMLVQAPTDGSLDHTLAALIDDDQFLIASGGAATLTRARGGPCLVRRDHVSVDAVRLAAALAGGPAAPDASAALRRLIGRALRGVVRVSVAQRTTARGPRLVVHVIPAAR